jgi:DNA repair exonuclease SbcCD nuclease subunit
VRIHIVRIAHISDTHLGYTRYAKLCPETNRNQREVDVQEAYGRAVDEILERDVDLVIHSGDVFDSVITGDARHHRLSKADGPHHGARRYPLSRRRR